MYLTQPEYHISFDADNIYDISYLVQYYTPQDDV